MSDDWWKGAVIYQIYPRSYCDSTGNGTGDLPGIISKMDYIASLGVDAIWLSPFQKSPMRDFGYDVSDYCDVDPLFGTMDDFDNFLAAAHKHDIKIIIDMVLSHTSDQHAWFKESRQSRTNDKADWYVWDDPQEDGTAPNNWLSIFGGTSWEFCSHRNQYYLHNFLVSQPDLNLHNPEVQDAVLDACEFWLKRGVDGFRLDALSFYFHSQGLENNPVAPKDSFGSQLEQIDPYSMQQHKYDISQPELPEFLKRIRQLMDKYDARMTVGEVGGADQLTTSNQYTAGNDMLNTCYNFSLMGGQDKTLNAPIIREPLEEFHQQQAQGWPAWALCNHDVVRVASRWGKQNNGEENSEFAKMLIALLTSLRGTVFIYQGEELGFPEAELKFEELQDPWGIYLYPKWQGRDGCRTPMAWSDNTNTNYGFSPSAIKSWLPISEKHIARNAESQDQDENSVLNFTREFLKKRKTLPALITGDITFIETNNESLIAFERSNSEQTVECVFNLTDEAQVYNSQTLKAFAFNIEEK